MANRYKSQSPGMTLALPMPAHAARRSWFIDHGWTRTELDRATEAGLLLHPTHGWRAVPDCHPLILRALAQEAVLTCVSALEVHGIEVCRPQRIHLRPLRARPARRPWCRPRIPCPVDGPIDTVEVATACAVNCLRGEELLVLLDSLIRQRALRHRQVATLMQEATKDRQQLLSQVGGADAIGESILHHRLHAHGIRFRSQVVIRDVGRVDVLVGDRLVIEVDGHAFHNNPKAFEEDRRRDRALMVKGFIVLRLTYTDLFRNWTAAEQQILHLVRHDRHRYRGTTREAHVQWAGPHQPVGRTA